MPLIIKKCWKGVGLQWYHTLEKSKKSSWKELSKAFLGQFSFNTVMNVGLRELENTTQGINESFPDYLNRWRKKLVLIRNKPDEQELIKIFINGTLTPFRNQMYCIPLRDCCSLLSQNPYLIHYPSPLISKHIVSSIKPGGMIQTTANT